jgi:hypothetical protein
MHLIMMGFVTKQVENEYENEKHIMQARSYNPWELESKTESSIDSLSTLVFI